MAVKAFPTAEGYGANTTHARGAMQVFVVSNLNNSGAGSLREACDAVGPRYVMFSVGGTITLSSNINITNPNIYIAGQTCPIDSGGILLRDYQLTVATGQACLRFFRIRVGLAAVDPGLGRNTNALMLYAQSTEKFNVIFDHLDTTWSTDQNLDIGAWSDNVTVQWCSIGEGTATGNPENPLLRHNMGSLMGSEEWMGLAPVSITPFTKRLTSHHNWYHSVQDRCPTLQMFGRSTHAAFGNPTMIYDHRNNLIFNNPNGATKIGGRFYTVAHRDAWIAATSAPRHCLHANIMSNLMLPGAGPNLNNPGNDMLQLNPLVSVFARNNRGYKNILGSSGLPAPFDGLLDDAAQASDNGVDALIPSAVYLQPGAWDPVAAGNVALAEFNCPPVVTQDVDALLPVILAQTGCTFPMRDSVLDRWIAEVNLGLSGGNAEITHSDYPTLALGTAPLRSQPDGIEDAWKVTNGFNTTVNYLGVTDPGGSGYDVIELYLNSIVGEVVSSNGPPVNTLPGTYDIPVGVSTPLPGISLTLSPDGTVQILISTNKTATVSAVPVGTAQFMTA